MSLTGPQFTRGHTAVPRSISHPEGYTLLGHPAAAGELHGLAPHNHHLTPEEEESGDHSMDSSASKAWVLI